MTCISDNFTVAIDSFTFWLFPLSRMVPKAQPKSWMTRFTTQGATSKGKRSNFYSVIAGAVGQVNGQLLCHWGGGRLQEGRPLQGGRLRGRPLRGGRPLQGGQPLRGRLLHHEGGDRHYVMDKEAGYYAMERWRRQNSNWTWRRTSSWPMWYWWWNLKKESAWRRKWQGNLKLLCNFWYHYGAKM